MSQYENLDKTIQQTFQTLPQSFQKKYIQTLDRYKTTIIPFEIKRIKQNQNLSTKNITLQRDRRQLSRKIQNIISQNQRVQYVLKGQKQKINELQTKISELDRLNNQNMNIIQVLQMTSQDLQDSINKKSQIVKSVQEQKKNVLKQYENKNNQYNTLLSNYMKQKNQIAEKLNHMNDLQQNLFNRQKKLKQEQLYLKKQWEQFEENKKIRNQRPKIFKKVEQRPSKQQNKEQPKPKFQKQQLLNNPAKKIIKHHNNQIYDISFNYQGNTFATCGGDRMIKIYDITNFQNISAMQTHSQSVPLCLCMDYAGERILVGSTDKSVMLYSVVSGKEIHGYVGHGYKVNCVAWTCQKQKFISGSEDKQIKIWDLEKGSNIFSIPCGKAVKCLTANPVQPFFYSGHSDGSVRLYSLNQNNTSPISQIRGVIDYPINSIVVLNDHNQLLVSSQQGSPLHILDLKMNKSIAKYEGKDFYNTVGRAQLSPSEKYILAGNCDGFIYYWNRVKRNLQKRVSGHDAGITAMKYHQLSNNLVSCDKQGSVIIWQQN